MQEDVSNPETAGRARSGLPKTDSTAISASLPAWLRCPSCHAIHLGVVADRVTCRTCGRSWPMLAQRIPYFVQERAQEDAPLREEIESQEHATPTYEDARRLTSQWNRRSIRELGSLLTSEPGIVLDLGCGLGDFAEAFPRFRVLGVDVTPSLLTRASGRCEWAIGADLRDLPFPDEAFAACFVRGALHHLPAPEAALSEAHRVLRKGGEIVLLDPRAFAALELVKKIVRRRSRVYSKAHTAFPRRRYREMIEAAGFRIERFEDWDPFGLLVLTIADELGLGVSRAAPAVFRTIHRFDAFVRRCMRRAGMTFGFTMAVRARKP